MLRSSSWAYMGLKTKCVYTILADFYFIKKAFHVVDIVLRSSQMTSTITPSHTTNRNFPPFQNPWSVQKDWNLARKSNTWRTPLLSFPRDTQIPRIRRLFWTLRMDWWEHQPEATIFFEKMIYVGGPPESEMDERLYVTNVQGSMGAPTRSDTFFLDRWYMSDSNLRHQIA